MSLICISKAHVNLFHVVNTHVEREKPVHRPGSLEGKISIRSIHANLFVEHPEMHKHDLTCINIIKTHANSEKNNQAQLACRISSNRRNLANRLNDMSDSGSGRCCLPEHITGHNMELVVP